PVSSLRRITLRAEVVIGPEGLRRTELVTARALDRVESPALPFALDELRQQLIDRLLSASVVPARATQRYPATRIVEAFLGGLGPLADKLLSSYLDRASAGLIQLVTDEHRKVASKPTYGEVVELWELAKVRIGRPQTSADRFGTFK